MSTASVTSYRSTVPPARDRFAQLLRAEWTKFRTIRGWLLAAFGAAVLIVLFGYLGTFRHQSGLCTGPSLGSCQAAQPHVPIGPGGEAVTDTYYFVHRNLTGDGSITVRVGSLTGRVQGGNGNSASVADMVGTSGPLQPWAKAGLILSASPKAGSAYAAVMLTGAHGVRLQYDYTGDIAGPELSGSSARWLRLTRSGAMVTGYESADATTWIRVGSVHLAHLPQNVQAGLFVTSPPTSPAQQALAPDAGGKATGATATFTKPVLAGTWLSGAWTARNVGADGQVPTLSSVGYRRSGPGFEITGSGDIAPAIGLPAAYTDKNALTGVFIGLIVLIVLGVTFITSEYRRGLIHTTLTATPDRRRVLIAKALVIATVAFVAGTAASAVSIPLGNHILRTNGNYVYPAATLTQLRVMIGTGALVALAAVLAVALGTVLRRGAAAVTATIVLIVLPYMLAFAAALPAGVSAWLLRITPAAGFAIQQTLPQYHQVASLYTPAEGFYPLAPGAGLAVLAAYTLAALLLANRVLRTRDA
jgi:ABC-type transport system involved in multi-copper enzyme maturation permease subunit